MAILSYLTCPESLSHPQRGWMLALGTLLVHNSLLTSWPVQTPFDMSHLAISTDTLILAQPTPGSCSPESCSSFCGNLHQHTNGSYSGVNRVLRFLPCCSLTPPPSTTQPGQSYLPSLQLVRVPVCSHYSSAGSIKKTIT